MTNKKTIKVFLTIMSFVSVLALFSPALVQANADSLLWGNTQGEVGNAVGLGNQDPRVIAASVINVILGFLGIIAVGIILLAGFKWMTAGGNEDKIGEAKSALTAGVIGLVIILAAWGIASFVIGLLYNATNAVG